MVSSVWSVIRVVSHQSGLHQYSMSSGRSLCGRSRWSVVSMVYCQGGLSGIRICIVVTGISCSDCLWLVFCLFLFVLFFFLSLSHSIAGGFERSDGVLFLEFTDRFKQGAQLTAWPGAICSTARLFMGTANGGSGDGNDNHLNVDNDNDGGD